MLKKITKYSKAWISYLEILSKLYPNLADEPYFVNTDIFVNSTGCIYLCGLVSRFVDGLMVKVLWIYNVAGTNVTTKDNIKELKILGLENGCVWMMAKPRNKSVKRLYRMAGFEENGEYQKLGLYK